MVHCERHRPNFDSVGYIFWTARYTYDSDPEAAAAVHGFAAAILYARAHEAVAGSDLSTTTGFLAQMFTSDCHCRLESGTVPYNIVCCIEVHP